MKNQKVYESRLASTTSQRITKRLKSPPCHQMSQVSIYGGASSVADNLSEFADFLDDHSQDRSSNHMMRQQRKPSQLKKLKEKLSTIEEENRKLKESLKAIQSITTGGTSKNGGANNRQNVSCLTGLGL